MDMLIIHIHYYTQVDDYHVHNMYKLTNMVKTINVAKITNIIHNVTKIKKKLRVTLAGCDTSPFTV